jgi:4-hydroxyphenylpyruvate dioxygenase
MTSYARPTEDQRPAVGTFLGYDHITIMASNAKQTADWYCIRFGFEIVARRGLETGSRRVAAWVLQKGKVLMNIVSPLVPPNGEDNLLELNGYYDFSQIGISGDHIHDVSFRVKDCEAIYEKAIERGAISVHPPITLKDDDGEVIICKIKTYGNVSHTLIQRNDYKGVFMPGYQPFQRNDPVLKLLPCTGLEFIDHIVGNQPEHQMESTVEFYVKTFDHHRFWSVDDKQICTEFTACRSIVVTDFDELIRFPINEPAKGLKKSQIQEFVEYHGVVSGIGGTVVGEGGSGVQHVALQTKDAISTVSAMRARGTEFLRVPSTYYVDLRKRLQKSPVKVEEDLDKIEELGILVDFDENGYLLQLFTRVVQDRPTLFFEVIQRHNHEGFGIGNFGALFKALEAEQDLRGNM